jgi:hypothetical protein
MKKSRLCALVLVAAAAACDKSPTAPSSSAPPTSTVAFDVAAGQGNPAFSLNYTTANASFGASVRTTCVPNPNIAGSVCPDLMVGIRGTDGRQCTMSVLAPVGQTLRVGSYPKAAFSRTADTAGFFFNCARAGSSCGDSASSFTLHELRSNPDGVVTRLHMTFEQTCLGGFPPAIGFFGTGTGELWIVDGASPFL